MKLINGLCVMAAMLMATNAMAAKDKTGSLQHRVELLESALAPTSVEGLVKLYADAVQSRNGAVQYMLFCGDLQKKHLMDFQEMNWVTGTSSPSVMDYKINKLGGDKYSVTFTMGMQGKAVDKMVDALDVTEGSAGKYCISGYSRS